MGDRPQVQSNTTVCTGTLHLRFSNTAHCGLIELENSIQKQISQYRSSSTYTYVSNWHTQRCHIEIRWMLDTHPPHIRPPHPQHTHPPHPPHTSSTHILHTHPLHILSTSLTRSTHAHILYTNPFPPVESHTVCTYRDHRIDWPHSQPWG